MLIGKKKRDVKSRLLPLTLSAGIIVIDQIVKIIIMRVVPKGRFIPVIGDFFRITFVQNLAMAFSIGRGMPQGTQRIVFGLLPLVVVVLITLYYLFTRDEFSGFQKWCFGALIGGGLSNYIDRLFRPAGVVDFLDFKFYGIFGLERWPTFNLADATVVVSIILLAISFLIPVKRKQET
jgi:signal peptidase II